MIPEILLANVEPYSGDQKRLLLELQLMMLWHEVNLNRSKPYNRNDAVKLQIKLASQRAIRLSKEEREKAKIEEARIMVLRAACRGVVEGVLSVEVNADADMIVVGESVDFDAHVKDALTKTDYGTVRELLLEKNFDWSNLGDPRKDLAGFVANLKRYDGTQIPYVFERYNLANPLERYCKFNILLKWESVSDNVMMQKFRKLVKKVVSPLV